MAFCAAIFPTAAKSSAARWRVLTPFHPEPVPSFVRAVTEKSASVKGWATASPAEVHLHHQPVVDLQEAGGEQVLLSRGDQAPG